MSSSPPGGSPGENAFRPVGETGSFGAATGHTIPPGWYPTPTGEQRYWDGAQWLPLPPPPEPAMPGAGSDPAGPPKNRRLVKWLAIAAAAALVLGLIGGGIAWAIADNARQEAAAAEAAAERAAAEKAADEREQQERAEAAAAAAKERRNEAERAARRASVTQIETSVKKMAEGHAADGIIDGPIIDVSCSPVEGGSTDDLTEQTTVFECFAAYQDNGDGTMSGWTYNATMNWSSGTYTFGLGEP